MEMTYKEAAEVLSRDDVSQRAIEVALGALEEVEIQGQIIVNLNRDLKAMRKAMNGQSEYAYLGGDLISREALRERVEMINWYSTNDKGVLHSGAADEESAYIRYADVCQVIEGALAVEAEPVVHAHWIEHEDELGLSVGCSACHIETCGKSPRCPCCGAHMDEELELRTCYCPVCDKHFRIRSNESSGSCPDCGHHVVLRVEEVAE